MSGLPKGDPAGKGLSLDTSIPGTSTFSKPSGEGSRDPQVEDSSMYRVDDADSLLKDQTQPDEIDHSKANPTMRRPGPHSGPGSITKYPYRDGVPNRHNASTLLVAHLWLSSQSPEFRVDLESPTIRVAAKYSDLETGLNSKVVDRSQSCSVTLKRADIPNMRWIFSVDAGNGPKVVRLKAVRKGNVVSISKMDVTFSCSCKAWRWLGSEYHAKGEKYLDGKPTGTASTPDIKDPERVNRVCKHVAAVIGHTRKWTIPVKKATPK